MAAEFDFIDWLRAQQTGSARVLTPAGDDMAVLRWDAADLLLVAIDQVLDGVHFDSTKHPPRLIGRKVMNRNLSDCAAMACLPAGAVVSVALPRSAGLEYVKELYLGLREAGDPFDCPIVGGDTGSWDGKLTMSVAILGRSAGIEPVKRSGARPGDGVYVTGPLGGSILGRHLTFTPRINEARRLAADGVTSMIDISDGLSRDVRHLCKEGGVGVIIEADRIPIHPDAQELAKQTGRSPLEHALHDGEDHELLFTTKGKPAIGTLIGEITADRRVLLREGGKTIDLPRGGWEHQISPNG